MLKKTTYILAYEACESFFSETGKLPTIESIKPIVKVNSPTTISTAIKDWKRNLSVTLKNNQPDGIGIPKILVEALSAIWDQALQEAKLELNTQASLLHETEKTIELQKKALDSEAQRLQQTIPLIEQKYEDKLTLLQDELKRLSILSVTQAEQIEYYRKIATENDKLSAVQAEQIRRQQESYIRLETQFNNEHEWALKRIEEEKCNSKNQVQGEIERLQSELTQYKQSCEILQAKLETLSLQVSKSIEKNIELERDLAKEKLKQANATLNEAKLRNEITNKEEKIRFLSVKVNKKRTPKQNQ